MEVRFGGTPKPALGTSARPGIRRLRARLRSCHGARTKFWSDFSHTETPPGHWNSIARSDALPGVERRFTSLRACAEECGTSRVFGGIHYRFSCEDGMRLGESVARWVVEH